MNACFEAVGLVARPLAHGDGPAFAAFGESVAGYGEGYYGLDGQELRTRGARHWLLTPRRPRLLALGLFDARGAIAGVLEVIIHHTMPDEWCVVLLLLRPELRGRGTGEAVYRAFEAWAVSQGARSFLLAVVESNPRALAFWSRLGFVRVATKPMTLGRRTHDGQVLVRIVCPRRREELAAYLPQPVGQRQAVTSPA